SIGDLACAKPVPILAVTIGYIALAHPNQFRLRSAPALVRYRKSHLDYPSQNKSAIDMEVVNSPDTRIRATEYLSSIWGSRYFWFSLVRMDLRSRYRRSVLGIGWSLLQPLAMTCVL